MPGIKRGRGEVILAAAVVLRAVLEASGADGHRGDGGGPARGDLPVRPAGAGRPAAGARTCARRACATSRASTASTSCTPSTSPGSRTSCWRRCRAPGCRSRASRSWWRRRRCCTTSGMAVDYDDHHKHSSLPDPRRRPARLHAARGRADRADGALPPQGHAAARRARRRCAARATSSSCCAAPRCCGSPSSWSATATRSCARRACGGRAATDGEVELELDAVGDDTVARWGAERQGELFERAFGAPLRVVAR